MAFGTPVFQGGAETTVAAASPNVALTFTVNAGDLIFLVASAIAFTQVPSVTDTQGNTYTVGTVHTDSTTRCYPVWARASSTGSITVTAVFGTNTANAKNLAAATASGVAASSFYDSTSNGSLQQNTVTSFSVTSGTITNSNELVFAYGLVNNARSIASWGAPYAQVGSFTGGTFKTYIGYAIGPVTGGNTSTVTGTFDATANYLISTDAFIPAAAAAANHSGLALMGVG